MKFIHMWQYQVGPPHVFFFSPFSFLFFVGSSHLDFIHHLCSFLPHPHPHRHFVVLFWMNLYLTQPLPIWWRGGSWMDEDILFFLGEGRGEG